MSEEKSYEVAAITKSDILYHLINKKEYELGERGLILGKEESEEIKNFVNRITDYDMRSIAEIMTDNICGNDSGFWTSLDIALQTLELEREENDKAL